MEEKILLKRYLEVGKIVNTHGIKGDLKVAPWCNSVEVLCSLNEIYLNEGKSKLIIKAARPHKSVAIMHIDGINTIEAAEKMKNRVIYADRNDISLDENEYFIQDIIGCEVLDFDTKKIYGTVTDVFKTGANDVYEITSDNEFKYLIPVIDNVIKETDIKNQIIKVTPIKGLFYDAD